MNIINPCVYMHHKQSLQHNLTIRSHILYQIQLWDQAGNTLYLQYQSQGILVELVSADRPIRLSSRIAQSVWTIWITLECCFNKLYSPLSCRKRICKSNTYTQFKTVMPLTWRVCNCSTMAGFLKEKLKSHCFERKMWAVKWLTGRGCNKVFDCICRKQC